MEEILASIRRIISDDQAPPTAQAAEAQQSALAPQQKPQSAPVQDYAAPQDDDEILDLPPRAASRKPGPHLINDDPVSNDLSFEDFAPPPPVAETPKGQDDINALMAAAEFEPAPMRSPAVAQKPVERLVSPTTDRMVSTAFSSLSNTILANNARTLDDLVQDMMRPMIKSWLDDNLPGVVERLVRAEIERVSRGGR